VLIDTTHKLTVKLTGDLRCLLVGLTNQQWTGDLRCLLVGLINQQWTGDLLRTLCDLIFTELVRIESTCLRNMANIPRHVTWVKTMVIFRHEATGWASDISVPTHVTRVKILLTYLDMWHEWRLWLFLAWSEPVISQFQHVTKKNLLNSYSIQLTTITYLTKNRAAIFWAPFRRRSRNSRNSRIIWQIARMSAPNAIEPRWYLRQYIKEQHKQSQLPNAIEPIWYLRQYIKEQHKQS